MERIEVGAFWPLDEKIVFHITRKIEELIKNANYVTYLCWCFYRLAFFKQACNGLNKFMFFRLIFYFN